MTRLRGWAPKGERLADKVPQGKWKTATFLAALRNDRIDAPCLFDGPINGQRFRAYVEQFLTPTLKPGDVVILNNLGSQRERRCDTSEPSGRASCSCPNTRPISTPSSRSSPGSKLCCERPKPEHTTLSPTQAQPSSLNTAPRMRQIPQKCRIRVDPKAGHSS
jgi:DDE superfamily endonuclease